LKKQAGLALAVALAAVAATAQNANPPGTTTQGPRVQSTAKIDQGKAADYSNKWEVYGGLSYMNGQAGQNLPRRYNMGGGEVMGTYWLTPKLGVAGDYRLEAGTTPLLPNPYYNRVLVTQNILSGGVQYRGPKNRYAAVDYHALFGASRGVFDHAIQNYPGGSPTTAAAVGLYPNTTTPWGAAGGSIDFNYSARLAIRISPDIIFEHFGTETREYVSVSAGVMYRFGHR
jgi:hypothetical protein